MLILITSAAASYSLLGNNILTFWTFIGLFAVGTVTILFLGFRPELFSILAALISLPTILRHSIVDWLAVRRVEPIETGFAPPTYALKLTLGQELTFPLAVGLGLLLILGYLALSYLQSLQRDYRTLVAGQAEIAEVNEVTNRNLILIAVALIASIALAIPVIILLMTVQPTVTDFLAEMPWNIIIAGLAAVLILAGYIYWLGARGKQ